MLLSLHKIYDPVSHSLIAIMLDNCGKGTVSFWGFNKFMNECIPWQYPHSVHGTPILSLVYTGKVIQRTIIMQDFIKHLKTLTSELKKILWYTFFTKAVHWAKKHASCMRFPDEFPLERTAHIQLKTMTLVWFIRVEIQSVVLQTYKSLIKQITSKIVNPSIYIHYFTK